MLGDWKLEPRRRPQDIGDSAAACVRRGPGRLGKFSLEKLIDVAKRMGKDVEIRLKPSRIRLDMLIPVAADLMDPALPCAAFGFYQVCEDVVDAGQVTLALGFQPIENPRVETHTDRYLPPGSRGRTSG